MLRYFIFTLFVIESFFCFAQDYEYVLPDSLPNKDKRAGVQLPIRASDPSPQFVIPSYAKENSDGSVVNDYYNKTNSNDDTIKSPANRTSINLEIGSSVSSDFNGNTAINTYAAPNVRHELSDDVAITAGVVMSQTFFDGWKSYRLDGGPMPSSINTNMVYGRIDYKLSDKMLVYGTVFTNITTMPSPGMDRNLQGTGYSIGMEYKVSERSFIQVQIQQSSGYNPFMPFNQNRAAGFGGRPFSYFP